MKKHKIYLLFAIFVGILFAPFFVGCGENIKITLREPINFGYQVNEETGNQLLVVEENPFASSYIFGISSKKYEDNDTSNFLRYEVPAKYKTVYNGEQIELPNNFFDVTNIFKNAQTYYYYVQYRGEGKYVSSAISEVKSVDINFKLDTPYLSISESTLSWTNVNNAQTYSIYSVIDGKRESVATTQANEYDVSNYINRKLEDDLKGEISFFVYCNSSQNYIRSADSNTVSYTKHLKLATPNNVRISKINGYDYLSWQSVKNCESYTIKVNNLYTDIVSLSDLTKNGDTLRYNVEEYYNTLGMGDYTFCVKANATGNFIESEYSENATSTVIKQLDTPQNLRCVVDTSTVDIFWDAVENAHEYDLEFSDKYDGYKVKKFVLNESSGIESSIINNAITLTYAQLKITGYQDIAQSEFIVRVRAVGYNYYASSSYSSGKVVLNKNEILETPVLQNQENNNKLTWNTIPDAKRYSIFISHNDLNEMVTMSNTYFDYSSYLTSVGIYKFKCMAVADDEIYNSGYSNIVTKEVNSRLSKPGINNVYADGDKLVISFNGDSNANTFSLFANENLIADSLTKTSNQVLISTAIANAQNNQVSFKIQANDNGFYTKSDKSDSFSFSTKLQTPHISISNKMLSWNSVENATSYILVLDDKYQDLSTTATSINLNDYVQANTARQIRLIASNLYLADSDLSSYLMFNNAQRKLNSYTDKYFYFGQTYDYYITSSDELFDIVQYSFLNFLPLVDIYIDFDTSKTISSKISDAYSGITGTRNYSYSVTNGNLKTGETKITVIHKNISDDPTYSSTSTQASNVMAYNFSSTRQSDYQFAVDNAIVSQDVYTTDGLLSSVQHHAKPNFVNQNSTAEQVYDIAKNILIQICDDNMTDYQKALAIHDWICLNVSYDTEGLNTVNLNEYLGIFHYIESALLYNLGVCDAYSKTFALLCSLENIECITVDGATDKNDRSHTGHSWNKIHLDVDNDGQLDWLAVDCTWDDSSSGTTEYLKHQYFMISDEYLAQRYEDTEYPSTTISGEAFYSIYKPYGVKIKIDSYDDVQSMNIFLASHSNVKLEILVKSQYVSSLGIFSYSQWTYAHNSDYKLIIKG